MAENTLTKVDNRFLRPEDIAGIEAAKKSVRKLEDLQAQGLGKVELGGSNVDIGNTQAVRTLGDLQGTTKAPPQTGTQTGGADPMTTFNQAIFGLMKKAQGIDATDLYKQRREIQRAAIGRQSEITPEALRLLSPAQQDAIRSGNTEAIRPELDRINAQIENANRSLDNFFKTFDSVRSLSKDLAENMAPPESVVQNAALLIQANPSNMNTILASFNDKGRQEVLKNLDYTKLEDNDMTELDRKYKEAQIASTEALTKQRSQPETATVTINGKAIVYDKATGQPINTIGGGEDGGSFEEARAIVENGTSMSISELRSKLQEETELNESEITSVLQSAGRDNEFDGASTQEIADGLIEHIKATAKKEDKLLTYEPNIVSKKIEETIKQLQSGSFRVDGKKLSPSQSEELISLLEAQK